MNGVGRRVVIVWGGGIVNGMGRRDSEWYGEEG